jgi:pilus assembly protein CpaB
MRLTQRNAILIAVACATAAAILIYLYLLGLKPKQKANDVVQQIDVVVPVGDIAPYTVIAPEMVVAQKLAATEAPKTPITRLEDVVDHVAVVPLVAQQPIKRGQVASRSGALGLTGVVPPGMRAVTVALDPVMGVAGLLKPRDRVDVVATFEVADTVIASTVLQDVELLALGKQMMTDSSAGATEGEAAEGAEAKATDAKAKDAEAKAPAKKKSGREPIEQPNATLAVTPLDAQRLMLADQRGELRLSLRPVGEHDIVPIPATTVSSVAGPMYTKLKALSEKGNGRPTPPAQAQPAPGATLAPPLGYTAPPATGSRPAAPGKPARTVEVIRGGQREQVAP